MNGLTKLNTFLNLLASKRMRFNLVQSRDDAIMVTFALVGSRYEVEFFEDRQEVSVFTGDESIDFDLKPVISHIEKERG